MIHLTSSRKWTTCDTFWSVLSLTAVLTFQILFVRQIGSDLSFCCRHLIWGSRCKMQTLISSVLQTDHNISWYVPSALSIQFCVGLLAAARRHSSIVKYAVLSWEMPAQHWVKADGAALVVSVGSCRVLSQNIFSCFKDHQPTNWLSIDSPQSSCWDSQMWAGPMQLLLDSTAGKTFHNTNYKILLNWQT